MEEVKEFGKYDEVQPSFIEVKQNHAHVAMPEDLEPIVDLQSIPDYFQNPLEDKFNSFLQRDEIQNELSEADGTQPMALVETNDDFGSKARKKLDDLKKVLAQQSNLLNQVGKLN
jgi:hypothetical protein